MAELEAKPDAEAGGSEATIAQSRDAQGNLVLVVTGEIDLSNVEEVRATIDPIVDAYTNKRLVFDLSALSFMDSSGIALFLTVADRVSAVELHNPSPLVRRVIEVTGLSRTLQVDR